MSSIFTNMRVKNYYFYAFFCFFAKNQFLHSTPSLIKYLGGQKKQLNQYLLLFFLFLFAINLNAQTLEIEAEANKTDILTGEELYYTLKYKCAGTTMNCTNVTMTVDIPSGIYIPFQNIGLTSDIASYTIANDYKSINFIFKDPLIAGNTGIIEFRGIARFGLPNNTISTLIAQLLTGGASAATATVNTTLHSYDAFCPQKSKGIGLALDNTTLYTVNLQFAEGSAIGVTNAGPVTLFDQMPIGVIIDSVRVFTDYPNAFSAPIGTCVVDNANANFTCSFPATSFEVSRVNGYTHNMQVRTYVRYPSATFAAAQNVNNTVTVTHTPEGGSPVTQNDGDILNYSSGSTYATIAPKTCIAKLAVTDPLANPAPKLKIDKGLDLSSIKPGEKSSYYMKISNTGNVPIENLVVEDHIPTDIDVEKIHYTGFTNVTGNENIQYWVKTVNNPTYTPIVFSYSVFTVPVGDRVTDVKITADNIKPSSFNNYGTVLEFRLNSATAQSSIMNCLTSSTTSVGAIIEDATACKTFTVAPADPFSTIALNKYLGAGAASIYDEYYQATQTIGTTVWSKLQARVFGGGQPLQKPMIMDLLPKGLTYDNSIFYSPGTPTADLEEVIPNYNGTGRTLVRLTWNTAWIPPVDYLVSIKTKVNDLAVAAVSTAYTSTQKSFEPYTNINGIKNTGFFTGSSPRKCWKQNYYEPLSSYEAPDIYDLNGNGIAIPDTICHASAYVGVASSAQLESVKWVKGQCDTDYSRYPAFGNTMGGGIANYKLIVRNNGNVPAKNFEIIDILPWVGDKGVIDPNPRLTEWRPNLVTPFVAPPGVIVYYSTETNPCRTDYVAAGPAGCVAANWSTILPQDPTTIQSIKIDFGTKNLNPGDQVEINWDMRAPVNAPTNNEIAWNSFGFKANRADNNDEFLPAEPLKVGIKLKPNQPGNYGDYVWLDTNKDGIQDAGEAGIDGVRVELYLDNGDGINNPKTDQLAAFTSTANGGLYLFPAIPVGDYYAVFFLPPGYSNSPSNATADDKDSDGVAGTCNGNRVMIVPITTISSNETDLTWDQGIFPDKAAVGNYVWFDENQNNVQDEPAANGINGVKVCLYKSDNTLVATDTTSNDVYGRPGYYLFDLLAAGDYYIKFKPTADKTYTPNTGTVGGTSSDQTDSDADATGQTATFTLAAGQIDLTWDAGLIIQTGPYKLGNFVWNDVNNDGVVNPTEVGINNVTVNLYKDNNNDNKPQADEFVVTTLTGTAGGFDGIYTFERLPAGDYIVQIPDQNFSSALKDFISSTGNDPSPDPDNNTENDDNGTAATGCGIISKPITLGATAEPLDAGTTNYSVDFGFYKCTKPNYTASVIQPTCAGGTGSITIAGGTVGDKVGYTIGTTHTGTYSTATLISSLTGGIVIDNIAGGASDVTYTLKVYNGEEACYKDFTFVIAKLVCCTQPTAGTNTPAEGTCTGATPNNDAKIDFTGITNADKAGISEGATYTGTDYASTTGVVTAGATSFTSLKHNTQYTVRIFNAANDCFIDLTITTPTKTCVIPCTPPTAGTNTPTEGTCNAATPNNDAKIDFTGITNADKAGISEGATYTGTDYATTTGVVTVGATSFTGLKHNTQYTFRIFNAANDCFVDVTITTPNKICSPTCTQPTAGTNTPAEGTCTGATANDDAKIDFTGITNADKAGIIEGATYTGTDYASTTGTVTAGATSFTGLKHNTQYTVRIFNAANDCFIDVTITTPTKTCTTPCPPKVCSPVKVTKL